MSGCKEDTPAAPALPVLLDPTDITHESFIMHWEITGTAESFSVDIGTDDIFVDFQTFTGIPGTARSIGINGLESHTEYFYRIRAMNGSVSSLNSSFGSVYTLPVSST